MDKLLNFVIANNFLVLLSFLYKKLVHSDPFVIKAIKARDAGEPVLITLVSRDAIAAGV